MIKKAKDSAFTAQFGPEGADALGLVGERTIIDADVTGPRFWANGDPRDASFIEVVGKLLKEKPLPCVGCKRSFESKPDGVGALVRIRKSEGFLISLICHECAQQRTAEELIKSAVKSLGAQIATD